MSKDRGELYALVYDMQDTRLGERYCKQTIPSLRYQKRVWLKQVAVAVAVYEVAEGATVDFAFHSSIRHQAAVFRIQFNVAVREREK